jgi:hypothetical protein
MLVHQIQPLEPILNQFNPVHVLIPYLSNIHININPPFCSNLPTPTFPSGYPTKLLYAHLTSPIRPAYLTLRDSITLPWHIQKLAYYQTKYEYMVQSLTLFKKIYEVLWLWVLVQGRRSVFSLAYPQCAERLWPWVLLRGKRPVVTLVYTSTHTWSVIESTGTRTVQSSFHPSIPSTCVQWLCVFYVVCTFVQIVSE